MPDINVNPVGEAAAASGGRWAFVWAVQEHWLGSFLLNLLGYAIIILPAAFLIRRWKKDPDVQAGEWSSCMAILLEPLSLNLSLASKISVQLNWLLF